MSKPKKTPEDEIHLARIGTNLGILQMKIRETLIPWRGQKIFSDEMFAKVFEAKGSAVQKWKSGAEIGGLSLYRLFQAGQSIDALFRDGSLTIPPLKVAQLFAAQELENDSREEVTNAITDESKNIGGTEDSTHDEPREDNKRGSINSKPRKF